MLNMPVSLHLNIILGEGTRGPVAIGAGPRKVIVSQWGFFIGGSDREAAAAASARAEAALAFISVVVGAW